MKPYVICLGALVATSMFSCTASGEPATKPAGPYYGVFRELPVQDITPEGWLAQFLQRQRDGLATHRDISGYPFDTCMWSGKLGRPKADGQNGTKYLPAPWDSYEQTAYYLDGTYRCGLLLRDQPLQQWAVKNFQYVIAHPQADGKLGPADMNAMGRALIGGAEGVLDSKGLPPPVIPTQWPFAVLSRALMAYYDATGDKKLLEALTAHYLAMDAQFGVASRDRDVDNVEGMCWLYGQTGDQRIIDKAELTYRNFAASPKSQWNLANLAAAKSMHGHGVTVSEATKQPALLYLYTGKKEYLDAVLGGFNSLQRDHEMVDGVTTSDAGLSGKEPQHEHETCVISDYSWSLGYVLQACGDAKWADTIERCVLNAGLSVVDKDFKSLQYYAAPNQMIATNGSMKPTTGVPYRELQAFRPDMSVQCCTGNVQRFLPNYAGRMWMSDNHGGLAATLYAPATLQATAGPDGAAVTIAEKTDYPFDGAVNLTITTAQPVHFPLFLRIPGWADGATIAVNGQPVTDKLTPATFYKLDRTFNSGDVVSLNFPMKVRLENPVAGSVSVVRGPLVYALKMKVAATVSAKRLPNTTQVDPQFPSWDLTPASPWNYALALKDAADVDQIKVAASPVKNFPWTPETSPVVLTVPARKVPAWVLTDAVDRDGKQVQTSPALPAQPLTLAAETEQVELIPDGATQLRVTVFPTESTPATGGPPSR